MVIFQIVRKVFFLSIKVSLMVSQPDQRTVNQLTAASAGSAGFASLTGKPISNIAPVGHSCTHLRQSLHLNESI
jgi:hypothetical protein